MERSVDRVGRPMADLRVERPRGIAEGSAATGDEQRQTVALLVLLVGEIAAFAALAASGNMPGIVSVLFRALLTL